VKVVKLPDGRLRIPVAASGPGYHADAAEIIGPGDSHYQEYLPAAWTEEEHVARERDEMANAELLRRWSARYEAQHGQTG
jgi:hypothetical protein